MPFFWRTSTTRLPVRPVAPTTRTPLVVVLGLPRPKGERAIFVVVRVGVWRKKAWVERKRERRGRREYFMVTAVVCCGGCV